VRLNEKLIRDSCPSCGAEITLEAGSLGKKITCPKCRQSVVISNSPQPAAPKSARKAAPKGPRNGGHQGAREKPHAGAAEPRVPQPQRSEQGGWPAAGKRSIVYCICNGMLRKCDATSACCCYQSDGCVYADTPLY